MNKYMRNFSSVPSYMGNDVGTSNMFGNTEDRVDDPRFKVSSRIPYKSEITTRATVWDYYRTQLALPNDSDVLRKLGQNIEAVDELLCDARVKAALNNRRSGLLSLQWTIDQNEAPARVYKLIERIFATYNVAEVLSEMMMAVFYGYNVTEVIWESKDGLVLPTNLTGKAQRWFVYSDKNELRFKTKSQQVQGEPIPPRKFLVTRYHPRYDDPYAGREALFNACYWPVRFRRVIMQWGMQFLEKYGMPWLDISMEGGLQQDRLTEIVQTIQQTYQDGIIAHPDNTKVTKMDMDDSKSIENYTQWLDILNREIDIAILGNNMSVEIKGGSFAAAQTLAGVRDDIIKEDVRMIESTMNQLIEWIAWFNFPANINLPKFKLYKSEPATLERAQIDQITQTLGVKLNKEYFSRTYGYNDEEFELSDSSSIGTGVSDSDAQVIQDAGIETKDQASNTQTNDAIIAEQKRGYRFTEEN